MKSSENNLNLPPIESVEKFTPEKQRNVLALALVAMGAFAGWSQRQNAGLKGAAENAKTYAALAEEELKKSEPAIELGLTSHGSAGQSFVERTGASLPDGQNLSMLEGFKELKLQIADEGMRGGIIDDIAKRVDMYTEQFGVTPEGAVLIIDTLNKNWHVQAELKRLKDPARLAEINKNAELNGEPRLSAAIIDQIDSLLSDEMSSEADAIKLAFKKAEK